MRAPVVFAVVVTWNRRALLEQCLAHLMAQTRPCDGVIVIDNASDDGTADMLADAWATALLVTGPGDGIALAQQLGLEVLWLLRQSSGLIAKGLGRFADSS